MQFTHPALEANVIPQPVEPVDQALPQLRVVVVQVCTTGGLQGKAVASCGETMVQEMWLSHSCGLWRSWSALWEGCKERLLPAALEP